MVRRDGAAILRQMKALPGQMLAWLPQRLELWRRAALAVLWVEFGVRLLWRPAMAAAFCLAVALLGLVE